MISFFSLLNTIFVQAKQYLHVLKISVYSDVLSLLMPLSFQEAQHPHMLPSRLRFSLPSMKPFNRK
jgi:hypothetical protein